MLESQFELNLFWLINSEEPILITIFSGLSANEYFIILKNFEDHFLSFLIQYFYDWIYI